MVSKLDRRPGSGDQLNVGTGVCCDALDSGIGCVATVIASRWGDALCVRADHFRTDTPVAAISTSVAANCSRDTSHAEEASSTGIVHAIDQPEFVLSRRINPRVKRQIYAPSHAMAAVAEVTEQYAAVEEDYAVEARVLLDEMRFTARLL